MLVFLISFLMLLFFFSNVNFDFYFWYFFKFFGFLLKVFVLDWIVFNWVLNWLYWFEFKFLLMLGVLDFLFEFESSFFFFCEIMLVVDLSILLSVCLMDFSELWVVDVLVLSEVGSFFMVWLVIFLMIFDFFLSFNLNFLSFCLYVFSIDLDWVVKVLISFLKFYFLLLMLLLLDELKFGFLGGGEM